MLEKNKIAILIPARLDGVRLPSKVLMDFFGVPMVEHVRRRATLNSSNANVFVVSGDKEVLEITRNFKGKIVQTFDTHENGTSRCAEAATELKHDHFIIAQGDEILLLPRHLNSLLDTLQANPNFEMVNTVAPLKSNAELSDESIVKCLISKEMKIIMMFRTVPMKYKSDEDFKLFYKVLGLFSFSKELLMRVSKFELTSFEKVESIEQMRLIENDVVIHALVVDKSYPSVNVEKDILAVHKVLKIDLEQAETLKAIINEEIQES